MYFLTCLMSYCFRAIVRFGAQLLTSHSCNIDISSQPKTKRGVAILMLLSNANEASNQMLLGKHFSTHSSLYQTHQEDYVLNNSSVCLDEAGFRFPSRLELRSMISMAMALIANLKALSDDSVTGAEGAESGGSSRHFSHWKEWSNEKSKKDMNYTALTVLNIADLFLNEEVQGLIFNSHKNDASMTPIPKLQMGDALKYTCLYCDCMNEMDTTTNATGMKECVSCRFQREICSKSLLPIEYTLNDRSVATKKCPLCNAYNQVNRSNISSSCDEQINGQNNFIFEWLPNIEAGYSTCLFCSYATILL